MDFGAAIFFTGKRSAIGLMSDSVQIRMANTRPPTTPM